MCRVVVLNGSLEIGNGGVMVLPYSNSTTPFVITGCLRILGGSVVVRVNDTWRLVNGTDVNLVNTSCVEGNRLLVNVTVVDPEGGKEGRCRTYTSASPTALDRGLSVLLTVRRKCKSKLHFLIFVIVACSIIAFALLVLLVLFLLRKNGIGQWLWYDDPNAAAAYRMPPFKRASSKRPHTVRKDDQQSELSESLLRAEVESSANNYSNRNDLYHSLNTESKVYELN